MLQPADLLLLDEPTNDLDIPALEVLEDSLEEFTGALVLVSHDRELMDRLCTEVVGLDGRGGSAVYGSVEQWLAAYERLRSRGEIRRAARPAADRPALAEAAQTRLPRAAGVGGDGGCDPRRRAGRYRSEAEVQLAALAGHVALSEACRALDLAKAEVERLYARWQELEARSKPTL